MEGLVKFDSNYSASIEQLKIMGTVRIEGCPLRKSIPVDKEGYPQCLTIGVNCFETNSTVNLTEKVGERRRIVYQCNRVNRCNEEVSQV